MILKRIYFTVSTCKSKGFSYEKNKLIIRLCIFLYLIIFVFSKTSEFDSTNNQIFAQSAQADSTSIYVVKHSWHAGIIMPVNNLSKDSLPVLSDFPDKEYLEFGWGDSAYYRAKDPNFGQTLKAGGPPTPGILHIVGVDAPIKNYLNYRTALQFRIPMDELGDMIRFFRNEFIYADKNPVQVGPGLYGDSYFYRAQSKYTVFYNCNHWTANALQRAGISISTFGMFRVETLLKRLRKHGTPVNAN
ncbi:MAG: DUF2459 domain-containing protein [Candidatus Marinimicrobia bacterium]|nr:DUF2459 domain-containing protein [Candidatus Neomarinimicrobiota bacterium]